LHDAHIRKEKEKKRGAALPYSCNLQMTTALFKGEVKKEGGRKRRSDHPSFLPPKKGKKNPSIFLIGRIRTELPAEEKNKREEGRGGNR